MRDKIANISTYIIGIIYLFIFLFCTFELCWGMNIEEEKESLINKIIIKNDENILNIEEEYDPANDFKIYARIKLYEYTLRTITLGAGATVGCLYLYSQYDTEKEFLDIFNKAYPLSLGFMGGWFFGNMGSEFITWYYKKKGFL